MHSRTHRPLSPHLQVYRLLFTMVLSMAHRVSGLFLSLASLLLVGWLAAVAAGPEAYAAAQAFYSSLPVRILVALALAAFWFHFFTGLRHLAWDAGLGFEGSAPRWSGAAAVVLAAFAFGATVACTPIGRWLAGGAP